MSPSNLANLSDILKQDTWRLSAKAIFLKGKNNSCEEAETGRSHLSILLLRTASNAHLSPCTLEDVKLKENPVWEKE